MGNVAILSNTAWSIWNFRMPLIQDLIALGHEVFVFAPDDDFSKKFSTYKGLTFYPLTQLKAQSKNPLNDLSLTLEIRRLFKKCKINVYYGYTPKPNIFGNIGGLGLGIKKINTVNGLGYSYRKMGILRIISSFIYRIAFRFSYKVIFQNPDDKELFINKGIVKERNTILVNGSGIDLHVYKAKSNFCVESDKLTFVFCTRLIREKGVIEYMQAAQIVKKQYPKVKFLLYGKLAKNPNAISKSEIDSFQNQDTIDFKGSTDNINEVLENSDIAVMPSYYREGIPMFLLESLAKSLPIITTNAIGCKESVLDGENGYLVEPKNVQDLAQRMTDLIQMPIEKRREMALRSRRLAEDKFDVQIVNSAYLSLL